MTILVKTLYHHYSQSKNLEILESPHTCIINLVFRIVRINFIFLNSLLNTDRDPIPDVPAVYFISPTSANVARLCQDLKNELYESYYLNFISPIPRTLLEDVAQAAISANCVQQINKIFDQYSNFISLEDELFCLQNKNKDLVSYYGKSLVLIKKKLIFLLALNKGDVTESEMNEMINIIADGLFAVFVTMGSIPIIRCPKGTAAEYVAEVLYYFFLLISLYYLIIFLIIEIGQKNKRKFKRCKEFFVFK